MPQAVLHLAGRFDCIWATLACLSATPRTDLGDWLESAAGGVCIWIASGFELARPPARSNRRESGREIIGARLDRLRDRDKQVAVAIKDAAGAENRQRGSGRKVGVDADDCVSSRAGASSRRAMCLLLANSECFKDR